MRPTPRRTMAAESDQAMKAAHFEAREMVNARVEQAEREANDQLADLAREQEEKYRRAQEDAEQQVADLRHAEEEAAQKALKNIEAEYTSRTQKHSSALRAESGRGRGNHSRGKRCTGHGTTTRG